jgi:hypothetical protein
MLTDTSHTKILTSVAGSLVATQRYPTMEAALRDLALAAVRSKTLSYRRRIRRLERKYATDFDAFSAHLQGRATPAEEDDWFAWRSARRMLVDWQETYQELG